MRANVAVYVVLAALGGCATAFEGDSQTVAIDTFPSEAQCSLTRDGEVLATVVTPARVKVDKRKHAIDVLCAKPGYRNASAVLEAKFAQSTATNAILAVPLIFPAAIGVAGDAATGAMHKYDHQVLVALEPADGTPTSAARAAAFKLPVSSEMGKNPNACLSWSWSTDPEATARSPVCSKWR
jgi:hypothetical protein